MAVGNSVFCSGVRLTGSLVGGVTAWAKASDVASSTPAPTVSSLFMNDLPWCLCRWDTAYPSVSVLSTAVPLLQAAGRLGPIRRNPAGTSAQASALRPMGLFRDPLIVLLVAAAAAVAFFIVAMTV